MGKKLTNIVNQLYFNKKFLNVQINNSTPTGNPSHQLTLELTPPAAFLGAPVIEVSLELDILIEFYLSLIQYTFV